MSDASDWEPDRTVPVNTVERGGRVFVDAGDVVAYLRRQAANVPPSESPRRALDNVAVSIEKLRG